MNTEYELIKGYTKEYFINNNLGDCIKNIKKYEYLIKK